MGVGIEVIGARATNPGASVTALTVNTGNSFTVRSFDMGAPAYLEQMWAKEATPGIFRIRSARLHDSSQAIRQQVGDTTARLLLPWGANQTLYPSDVLTVEGTGGGAETDAFFYSVYYTNLGGVDARVDSWPAIRPRIRNISGVEVDATTSATAGDWSGGTAINATNDNFKANTDYAVLGYTVGTACGAVAIAGTDTGNLKVGGPGALDQLVTRQYFVDWSERTGRPAIPIVNSNNRGGTLLHLADPATSTSVHVTLTLAELAP